MKRPFARLLREFSVRGALALAIIPLMFLGALTIGLVTATLSTQEVAEQHIRAGEQMVTTLAQRSDLALLYESSAGIADTAGSLFDNPLVQEIRVVKKNGALLFARSNGPERVWPYAVAPAEGTAIEDLDDAWVFSREVRTAVAATTFTDIPEAALLGNTGNEVLGEVQLALSKDALFKARRSIFLNNLLTALGFSVLVVFAMLLVVRRFSRPLEVLAKAMHEARGGGWTAPESLDGPREIREIGESYIALMDALRQRDEELGSSIRIWKAKSGGVPRLWKPPTRNSRHSATRFPTTCAHPCGRSTALARRCSKISVRPSSPWRSSTCNGCAKPPGAWAN